MTILVLDTSVLVAAHLSRHGAAHYLLSAFYSDHLLLAFTPAILTEYAEVLARPKFAALVSSHDRIAFLIKLRASGLPVIPATVPADDWPNADDLPVVAAALAIPGNILVTLNPRDFVLAKRHGVRVLSPGEAKRHLL